MPNAQVWSALGAAMRRLREASGESLRQVEALGRWVRGTLSQVENGKARPSLDLVEFYDDRYGGDGLLVSMFVDANAWHAAGLVAGARSGRPPGNYLPGDAIEVVAQAPAHGALLRAGTALDVVWTVRNSGAVPWNGRWLTRVGAAAGPRLLASERVSRLPDVRSGESVEVSVRVTAPVEHGTVAAHWALTHADGSCCFSETELLSVTVVVVR
jgi:hypothetical protein